jgi:hypothetical protein
MFKVVTVFLYITSFFFICNLSLNTLSTDDIIAQIMTEDTDNYTPINVTQNMIDIHGKITNSNIIQTTEVLTEGSESIILEGKTIPQSSTLIYRIYPSIINATIVANLPCYESKAPQIDVLIGKHPYYQSVDFDYISEFSDPGDVCRYNANILASNYSTPLGEMKIINNSTYHIEFPPTSSLIIKYKGSL